MSTNEKSSLQVFTKSPFIWERQQDETDKAYQAFTIYRDMPADRRSIEAVVRKNKQKKISHYAQWSVKYEWVQRSRAFDVYLDIQARQKREKDHLLHIEEFSERQRLVAEATLKSAIAIMKKANTRLARMAAKDIEPGSLPSYYRAAAALIEAASNSESMALGIEQLLEALQQFKQR